MNATGVNIVRLQDVASQPWKNGGGVTRELLAWPSADDWAIRVSVADIECDGVFSAFRGIDRYFAVLDGNGVRLDGVADVRIGDKPVHFDGALAPHCRLIDGPTRDLNVMIRRNAGVGTLLQLDPPHDTAMMRAATLHGVYVASTATLACTLGENAISLKDLAEGDIECGRCFHFSFSARI